MDSLSVAFISILFITFLILLLGVLVSSSRGTRGGEIIIKDRQPVQVAEWQGRVNENVNFSRKPSGDYEACKQSCIDSENCLFYQYSDSSRRCRHAEFFTNPETGKVETAPGFRTYVRSKDGRYRETYNERGVMNEHEFSFVGRTAFRDAVNSCNSDSNCLGVSCAQSLYPMVCQKLTVDNSPNYKIGIPRRRLN